MENKKMNNQEYTNTGIAINAFVAVKVYNYYKLLADEDVLRHMQRAEWIYQWRDNVIQISKGENTQDIKNYNDTIIALHDLGIMVSENATEKRIKHFTLNRILMQEMNDLSVDLLSNLYPDKEINKVEVEMCTLLKLFTGTHLDIVNILNSRSLHVTQISKEILKEYFHTSNKIGELVSAKIIERTKVQVKDEFDILKDNNRSHYYKQNDIIVKLVSEFIVKAVDILWKYRAPDTIK